MSGLVFGYTPNVQVSILVCGCAYQTLTVYTLTLFNRGCGYTRPVLREHFYPHASKQGNVISLVSVYIMCVCVRACVCVCVCVGKKVVI